MATNWNDIINLPPYITNLENCLACSDIAALSAAYQLTQDQILNVLNQQNSKVSLNTFNKHHHDCRYFTKNQLKYPNLGGEVNWFNLTSLTPAMSAVYYSQLTPDHLLAITTHNVQSQPSSSNVFVTEYDLNAALSSNSLKPIKVTVLDATTITVNDTYATRQSKNIYDTYYDSQGDELTRDWSPIKHHLEYFVHRRNPYYDPPISGSDTEINWVDEDIDGNKVWIGERHIFTGGKDGVAFRSGQFSSGRAISADADVVGLPNISDLYNNVANNSDSVREKEFADRQVVIYGGLEIGRNLTLLPPISGSQVVNASGADAYFNSATVYGNLTYDGSIINSNGKFIVDSLSGSITGAGSISLKDHAIFRNYLQLLNSNGTISLFKVDSTNISGTQTSIDFPQFKVINGNITAGAIGSTNVINGNTTINGNTSISGNSTTSGNGVFGGKINVGGVGEVSTFGSSISAKGGGYFNGDITGAVNIPSNYKGFFGGDVLISGGLTIEDYFELSQDLSIHGNLTVDNNSLLKNDVTVSTKSGSKFVVGQTNNTIQAGDAYIINWTNSYDKVSSFKVFTREMGTSSNLFTLRMAEENVLGSGDTVGPSGTLQNRTSNSYIFDYNTWNGVDIRVPAKPHDVYKDDGTWSGLEVKSYLSVADASYKDSQYLLWTSNSKAFSKTTFPGMNGSTQNFPNTSENFGWIMSDWFRTATEETNGVRFPLHLVASKNYVDYRMAQLNTPGSSFQVAPENIGMGVSGTPSINDTLIWNGTNWEVAKLNISAQLWDIVPIEVSSNITISRPEQNTIYVLTDEGLDAPFTIHLPQQQASDEARELVFKFYNISQKFFPVTFNAHASDTIDGSQTYTATVANSAIRLFVNQFHSWIVV